MERAALLDNAVRMLRTPYMYELMQPDKGKRKNRMDIGIALSEILEDMRDELEHVVYQKLFKIYSPE